MAQILIVGCGDIGTRLAEILHQQDHKIFGLRRNPPTTANKFIHYIHADISITEDLAQLDQNFDFVFYLPTPSQRTPNAYQAIYINGLKNLLQVFTNTQQKPHLFLVSSTSVYGQNRGEWIDEDSATEPHSETARIIVKGEQIVWQNNPVHTVVRFSGIYGKGRERLLKKLENKPEIQFHPPYYTNRIHQDDCAAILAFLLNRKLAGLPLQPCYLASDETPVTSWEVMNWLAKTTNNPPPQALNKAAGASQNKRCCNKRLKDLGYHFIYPGYREGYAYIAKQTPR